MSAESEKAVAGLGRQEHISNYNAILGRKTSKIDIDDVGSSKDQSSQVDDKSKKVRSSAHSSTLDASNAQLHRKRKLLQEKEDAVAKEAGPQAALDRVVKTATRIASRPVVVSFSWMMNKLGVPPLPQQINTKMAVILYDKHFGLLVFHIFHEVTCLSNLSVAKCIFVP